MGLDLGWLILYGMMVCFFVILWCINLGVIRLGKWVLKFCLVCCWSRFGFWWVRWWEFLWIVINFIFGVMIFCCV